MFDMYRIWEVVIKNNVRRLLGKMWATRLNVSFVI